MKPADQPEFFHFLSSDGSRESSIRLDASGTFWHEGERIEHPGLAAALHRWIARHPDNDRYILSNGYDWTYFQVEDAPYTVRSIRLGASTVTLVLSDASEEPLAPETLRVGPDEAVYAQVKGGVFPAKFSRHAQIQLAPLLVEGDDGEVELVVSSGRFRVGREARR